MEINEPPVAEHGEGALDGAMSDHQEQVPLCRRCGAVVETGEAVCWLCTTLATTKTDHERDDGLPQKHSDARAGNVWSFNMTSLFFVVTLASVCLALAIQMPVLGMPLALLLVIGLVGTTVYGQMQRRAGRKWTNAAKVTTFARVIEIVMLTILWGMVASFVGLILLIFGIATILWVTGNLI